MLRFQYKTASQLGENGAGSWYGGRLATYGPGGFVRELRAKTFQTVNDEVVELYRHQWIDRGTRAIFLELTVYNPLLRIFCVIK